jgi:naphthalene 1,2-dioxygenase ferredoxin component
MSEKRGEWVDVLAVTDLEKDYVTPARAGNRELAIYDTPDGLYASFAYCTHGGARLTDGYFDKFLIECPLHQGCFDVRTGEPKGAPVTRALRMLEVRAVDGRVQVRL